MSSTIDYYFTLASPWSYLGHARFVAMAASNALEIVYVPVSFGPVFAETGGLPLPKRAPHRQRYRYLELQRWRERTGQPLNLRPKFWPFDVSLADRTVLAILEAGHDPDPFLRLAFPAVWAKDLDLGDEATIGRLLREAGLDPARTIKAAKSERIGEIYAANVQRAIAADVFGAPSYVRGGEVFWGQDRLDLLEDAITSARKPFTPL